VVDSAGAAAGVVADWARAAGADSAATIIADADAERTSALAR